MPDDDNVRILHIIETLGRGGAERQLVDLVRKMDQCRFQNTICYLYERNDLEPELIAAGVQVIGLGLGGRRDAVRAVIRLRRLLGEGYSILHTWLYDADIFGRIAGMITRTPVIVGALQNTWYEPIDSVSRNVGRAKLAAIRAIDSWTGRWSRSWFIASSDFAKRSAIMRLGFHAEMIQVIPNSVNPDDFNLPDSGRLEELKDELGLAGAFPVIFCAARLVPQKGHMGLLEAMSEILKHLPDARLLLAGVGPEEVRLRQRAKATRIEDRVHFLGQRGDVADLLQLSDLFAFPSLGAEGLPVAVVEALAAGTPCVAWNLDPNPEVIEHDVTGLLVQPGDIRGFASAIVSLAANRDRLEAMGCRCREVALSEFDVQKNTKMLEDFYKLILSN